MGGTLSLESVLCETLALPDTKSAAPGKTRDLNLQLCVKCDEVVVSSWPHRANPACFPAAKRLNEFEMLVINLDIFEDPLARKRRLQSAFSVSAANTVYKPGPPTNGR